ncbi:thermonuclease family protein [Melaminivora sp.]
MPASVAIFCFVLTVTDGDTLRVRCGQQRPEAVRVLAIDAPESRQAYGPQARQNLARLCLRQRAELLPQAHDKYGRLLAQVRCQGQDVAQAQVAAGLAWVYTRQSGQQGELAMLQQRAQSERRGLWAQPRPLAPWDYRQRYAKKMGKKLESGPN